MHFLILSVIGGWINTKSAYLCDSSGSWLDEVSTPGILSLYEDRTYFVSFSDNNIVEVGLVGKDPFLMFTSECAIDMKYLGIATGFGGYGDWTFCGYGRFT